jgi:MFS family permease
MVFFKKQQAANTSTTAKNINEFHGEAAATSVHSAGAAYDNPSLIASGAQPQNLALLAVFSNLVLSFLCIKTPGLIARLGTVKKSVLLLSTLSAIVWFPLVWLFFTGTATPVMLIPLFILNSLPIAILAPVRDSWLAGIVPGKTMGRYFSIRSVITSVTYLATFYVMGYMLDLFKGNTLQGFAIIFIAAALAMFANTLLYTKAPAPAVEETDDAFDFQDFLGEAKQGNLGTFIVFLSFFTIGVSLASPFFSVYMLRDLKLSYLEYTFIQSAEYIARIIAVFVWGRYADKVGSLKVMRICCNIIPFIPLLWIFARSPLALVGLNLFSGALWAGFDLCSATFVYKSALGPRRLKYILYQKSLNTLATAAGNLAGTYLLSIVMPIFGNPILTMFLLSGLVRFVAVRSVFHKLIDLTEPEKPANKVLKPMMTRTAIPSGLYYRPGEWVKAKEGPTSYKIPAENLFTSTTHFRPALYKAPDRWSEYALCQTTGKAMRFKLDKVGVPEYPGLCRN